MMATIIVECIPAMLWPKFYSPYLFAVNYFNLFLILCVTTGTGGNGFMKNLLIVRGFVELLMFV